MLVNPFLVLLYIQSRHSSYKNELATVLIVVSLFFFLLMILEYFFPASMDVLIIIFIPIIHTILLSPSQFFTAMVFRSHCGESLVTRANIFSTRSTFQSCISLIEARHTENTLRVLVNTQLDPTPFQADQN